MVSETDMLNPLQPPECSWTFDNDNAVNNFVITSSTKIPKVVQVSLDKFLHSDHSFVVLTLYACVMLRFSIFTTIASLRLHH